MPSPTDKPPTEAPGPPTIHIPTDAALAGMAVFLLVALEFLAALVLNDGFFTYTLDDPYIHLAVAEEICKGNYGINPGEVSSPSSSAIWPLLLVPLVATKWGAFVPLAINTACLAVLVALALGRVRKSTLDMAPSAGSEVFRAGLVLAFVLVTNAVGLVFTGMEHSLQLLCSALVAEGILRMAEGERPGWSFFLGAIAGPLVRYENLALTCAAVLMLVMTGRRVQAVLSGGLPVLGLVAFSGFLTRLGLPPMPNSVLAKSAMATGSGFLSFLRSLYISQMSDRGLLLALLVGLLAALACLCKRPLHGWRKAALALAVAGFLHLLFGAYGWYNRYEPYILGAMVWGIAAVCAALARSANIAIKPSHSLAIAPLVFAVSLPYMEGLCTLPVAANNIYEQQYQMHRFITGWWKQAVAVNDLGWVSFRNENQVLDLWGLGSQKALKLRMSQENPDWMDEMARENGVKLAALYAPWFPEIPANWIKVGKLRLSRFCVTPAVAEVSFYATAPEHAEAIQALLRDFRSTLPPGVELLTRDEQAVAPPGTRH